MKNALIALVLGLCWAGPATAQAPKVNPLPLAPLEAPRDLNQLDRFRKRCKAEGLPYMLSLKQLAEDCIRAEQRGGPLPPELRYLRGFTWFFGFIIDREGGDVVLLGMKDTDRPPMDIDCLATAIKALAVPSKHPPSCTLTKHPDPKYQKAITWGVDRNSRWAEIMIEADYEMKRTFLGLFNPKISGLKSMGELLTRLSDQMARQGRPSPNYAHRFWFDRPEQHVLRAITQGTDLVLLYSNPVIVKTKELDKDGNDTATTIKEPEEFARGFTWNLHLLARRYKDDPKLKSFGELLALFRLLDLLDHLKTVGQGQVHPPHLPYWCKQYKSPYQGPPEAWPTLSNESFRVQGGVRMPLGVDPKTIEDSPFPRGLKDRILQK